MKGFPRLLLLCALTFELSAQASLIYQNPLCGQIAGARTILGTLSLVLFLISPLPFLVLVFTSIWKYESKNKEEKERKDIDLYWKLSLGVFLLIFGGAVLGVILVIVAPLIIPAISGQTGPITC